MGDKGRAYFSEQARLGVLGAQFNRHIWEPYIDPGDAVLDFGCGGGFLLSVLDAQTKVGVEINPVARGTAIDLGIEVYETIADVPGKFNKIISSHALEHVPHPRQAILELKRKLLDQNSRLILLVPIDDWRSRANRTDDPSDTNMHLHTWTPQLLGNLLRSCGLSVQQMRIIQHAWPPGAVRLWRISPAVFHLAARVWAGLNKQRQLLAVAALDSTS